MAFFTPQGQNISFKHSDGNVVVFNYHLSSFSVHFFPARYWIKKMDTFYLFFYRLDSTDAPSCDSFCQEDLKMCYLLLQTLVLTDLSKGASPKGGLQLEVLEGERLRLRCRIAEALLLANRRSVVVVL